ncbi:MAG: alpha-glucosidase, partial [Opitutus sp.]|nr:alpha-glucosidase [Opitutus sp.]
LAGDPGRYAVMARQGDGRWFVAGINGEATPRDLALDLARVAPAGSGKLICDDGAGGFAQRAVHWSAGEKLRLTLPAHGGFVLTLE